MTLEEFKGLPGGRPPPGVSGALLALYLDAHGDWDAAHESAQAVETPDGAWVHAYLHRKEGDPGNARYWYLRAGRPVPKCSLESEWDQVAAELLKAEEA
jgi:hypothetical protein